MVKKFKAGEWLRRTREGQSYPFVTNWRYGNQVLQVESVRSCPMGGTDVYFAGDSTEYCGFYFETVDIDLTAWERDTALAMALELAREFDNEARPYLPSGESMELMLLADWLRDCVTRELWEGE